MIASSRIIFLTLAFLNALAPAAFAADATLQREQEWNRAVRAAEQEGEIVLSALSEVGEVFTHGGFQKKFPEDQTERRARSRRRSGHENHG